MSQIVSDVPASAGAWRRWQSIPEVTMRPWAWLWWFLLTLVAAPIFLIVRTGGAAQATGLLWMYAGSVGVFVVIRHQYEQILRWCKTFPGFIEQPELAEAEITSFARRPWQLHRACLIFCTAFTVAALLLFHRGLVFEYRAPVDRAVSILFVAIGSYICGIGLSAVFHVTRLIRRVADFDLYVAAHPYGVLSVGRMLAWIFMEVAVVWCCYTATVGACKGAWVVPAMGLAVPAVLFFGISFGAAQLPLHEAMVTFKQRQVQRVEASLRAVERTAVASVSEDQQRQIEFYEKRLQCALALPEWPFRWPAFAMVLGSGASTLLAPIVTGALSSLSLSRLLPLLKL